MRIVEWVLAALVGLAMLGSALNKLFSSEFRGDLAEQINLPGWFLVLVALWELTLVLDLAWPRFRILGGLGVVLTMIGAAISHVLGDVEGPTARGQSITVNIVLGVLGLAVAWLAAGRPSGVGPLLARARDQARGQVDAVADAADAVT
ncbi:MAG: DoxX family protein [Actinomycetota bacterium]